MQTRMPFRLLLATVFSLSALAAQAGGPVVVIPEPAPTPPPAPAAYDWSGFYGGLSYGRTVSSGVDDTTSNISYDFDNGSAMGLHAGYLMQNGNFVYGGELAYLKYNDVFMASLPNYEMKHTVDLKAKLGFAANRALIYGVLGYSTGKFETAVGTYKPSGMAYGVGVDFAVSDRVTVGLEYLARKMDDTGPSVGAADIDVDLNTLSLRAGFRF